MPALAGRDLDAVVRAAQGSTVDQEQLFHRRLSTIACHAAVRAGESLSDTERTQLVREAQRVDFYHNCPHGRPVMRWLSKREVEGWFER